VQHSEYTYISDDTSKSPLKTIYLEYFPYAIWNGDYRYYENKYRFNGRYPHNHYLKALLHNNHADAEYGNPYPIGRNYRYTDAANNPHSQLSYSIQKNRKRREAMEYNSDIGTKSNVTYSVNKQIYADGKKTETYTATDTIFDGVPCYKLTHKINEPSIYGKKEQDIFEQKLRTDHELLSYTQAERDELQYYVAYWAGREYVRVRDYIVSKQDYALLYYAHTEYASNHRREWFVTLRISEHYLKHGNKYRQDYYYLFALNFVRGIGFHNDKNIATWIVQRPLNRAYDLSALKKFPDKIAYGYEDFCDIVATPDTQMLKQWTMSNGQWTMDNGQLIMDNGQLIMDN
jgi:hypothetical protein